MREKLNRLSRVLTEMESTVVAYSGGVDSTLVLKVAHDALGEKAIAVTAVSQSLPERERIGARALAEQIGAKWVPLSTRETEDPRYVANAPSRCFFCKNEVYGELVAYARRRHYRFVVDGTNADDVGDHRPGRAAAREHGVRSPLLEAGLTKDEVRETARQLGLANWDKPAAACLASRIPYGRPVTAEALAQIECAEGTLADMGFRQFRVRHYEDTARIEVEPADFGRLLTHREEIVMCLREAGYTHVSMDLAGFRSGSMNETPGSGGH
ncbi:MAG: ATP-dependent sacrificial sulfur transferase LarE [Gemmatimonadota bacterium]